MNFELSEEQEMIRDSAGRLTLRYGKRGGSQTFGDRQVWRELGASGFLSLGLPEQHGGIGGHVEIALVAREFGRHLLQQPFAGSAIYAAQAVAQAGSPERLKSLLPAMLAGEVIAAVAHLEGSHGASGIQTVVRREGDRLVVNGQKTMVLGGTLADLLVVSASEEGVASSPAGISLLLVRPDDPGVTLEHVTLVDGTACARVALADVEIQKDDVLALDGADALDNARRYAILALGAELLGASEAAMSASIDYLKTRKQFGVPLSTFQVLRHRVTDMAIDLEMAEAALNKLLASFDDSNGHDPAMTLSLAKATIDEVAVRITREAIQVHGAMGLTEECGVGHFHTRATLNRSLFANASQHVDRYAALLAAKLTSG